MLSFKNSFPNMESEFKSEVFNALKDEKESGKIGYYTLFEATELIEKIKEYARKNSLISKNKISDVVVIGIGGSSLGGKAIDRVLHKKEGAKLHFLENSDPINLEQTLSKINSNKTIFILISKSGGTIETTSIFKHICARYAFEFDSKKLRDRLIIITDNGSPLSNFAKKYSFCEFNIPLNVGGRFSVLSAVGLVPLYLAGVDIEELLKGAEKFSESFFNKNEMHLLNKANFYAKNYEKHPINVIFAYSSLLEYFVGWYVQLWGESLGKINIEGKSVGLTPIGLIGSIDQHSFLQLIMQGVKDKTVTFLKVKEFEINTKVPDINIDFIEKTNYINNQTFETLINAQCDSTLEAITEQGVITDLIELDILDESSIGALIYYYELLTSAVGVILKVNTYDQPGVELGKVKLEKKFKG